MQDAIKQAINFENKRKSLTNNQTNPLRDKESPQIYTIFIYHKQEQNNSELFRFIKIRESTEYNNKIIGGKLKIDIF